MLLCSVLSTGGPTPVATTVYNCAALVSTAAAGHRVD